MVVANGPLPITSFGLNRFKQRLHDHLLERLHMLEFVPAFALEENDFFVAETVGDLTNDKVGTAVAGFCG